MKPLRTLPFSARRGRDQAPTSARPPGRRAPQVAAPRWLGTTLGAWFLTVAAANKLGGEAGALWRQVPPALFFGSLAALSASASGQELMLSWGAGSQLRKRKR